MGVSGFGSFQTSTASSRSAQPCTGLSWPPAGHGLVVGQVSPSHADALFLGPQAVLHCAPIGSGSAT